MVAELIAQLCFLGLVVGQTAPRMSISEVRGICSSLASRLGMSVSTPSLRCRSETLSKSGSIRWRVEAGSLLFSVDDRFGYVALFLDSAADAEARSHSNSSTRYFTTDDSAWMRAEAIRSQIGNQAELVRGVFSDSSEATSLNRTQRGFVQFTFESRPFGRSSGGQGNRIAMLLDQRTGRLVMFTQSTGWTFDSPEAAISEASARTIAAALVRAHLRGLVDEITGVRQAYIQPQEGFGSSLQNPLRIQRRVRWAYVVRFPRCVVYVDAQTGAPLGGARFR